jgi:hypothetical protein
MMMTQTEALRLALEALESGEKMQSGRLVWIEHDISLVKQAITAVEAALEAKDEPVAWMRTSGTGSPVVTEELLVEMPEMRWNFQQPLYTTSPQRTWLGLTRDEILEARWHNKSSYKFARVLEDKLKEKNI